MAQRPAVSVLMSVRNGHPYLAEAIDSIVNQGFTDWEMVVIDNASTDGSADYVEARAADDPRIRLLRNERDLGIAGALNRGLEICRGDWIARMDADDRALPDRLARQLDFVAEWPALVATSCFAHYIDTAGDRIGLTYSDMTTPAAFERYMRTDEQIMLLHPGALIRRETLESIGRYRPEYVPAEDMDLWARLSEVGLLLVQPERLMEYRIHDASTMSTAYDRARLKQEWARASMLARRAGKPEPAWADFERRWQTASLWHRLHRRRRMLSEKLCRRAREDLGKGARLIGFAKLSLAGLLRPGYTALRLKGHLGR